MDLKKQCRHRGRCDSVDYDVIWGVLNIEAGKLKESVQAILAKEFPEAPPR